VVNELEFAWIYDNGGLIGTVDLTAPPVPGGVMMEFNSSGVVTMTTNKEEPMGIEEDIKRVANMSAGKDFYPEGSDDEWGGYGKAFSLHGIVRAILDHLKIEPIANAFGGIELRPKKEEEK
jgi:hypothetical protein